MRGLSPAEGVVAIGAVADCACEGGRRKAEGGQCRCRTRAVATARAPRSSLTVQCKCASAADERQRKATCWLRAFVRDVWRRLSSRGRSRRRSRFAVEDVLLESRRQRSSAGVAVPLRVRRGCTRSVPDRRRCGHGRWTPARRGRWRWRRRHRWGCRAGHSEGRAVTSWIALPEFAGGRTTKMAGSFLVAAKMSASRRRAGVSSSALEVDHGDGGSVAAASSLGALLRRKCLKCGGCAERCPDALRAGGRDEGTAEPQSAWRVVVRFLGLAAMLRSGTGPRRKSITLPVSASLMRSPG